MAEEYVLINGFENYGVNSKGVVKNTKFDRILKPRFRNGYYAVDLCSQGKPKTYYVHRLVAEAFLVKPKVVGKFVVDHINGDKTDNRVENLRFVSFSENSRNRLSHYSVDYDFVEVVPSDSLHITSVKGEDCSELGFYYDKQSDEFFLKMAPERYRVMRKHPLKNGYRIYLKLNDRFIYYSSYQIRQEYGEYFDK